MTDEAKRAIQIVLMIVCIVAAAKGVCELIAAHRLSQVWHAPEIRKVEPPKARKAQIRSPFRVTDVAMRKIGDDAKLCTVTLECLMIGGER